MKVTLAHLLSVTTSVSCFEDFGEIKVFLSKMVGESLSTHQLIRASKEIEPYLREQFPFLNGITPEMISGSECLEKVAKLAEKYGNEFEVFPIHQEDHETNVSIEQAFIDAGIDPSTKLIISQEIELNPEDDEDNSISSFGDINWKV